MKILAIVLMALFLVSSVAAITNDAQLRYLLQQQEKQRTPHAANVTGLPNAMMRVQNEEQRVLLQSIMEKIINKARVNTIKNPVYEIDDKGDAIVTGEKRLFLFGFLPTDPMVRYKISSEGELTRVLEGVDFLYTEESYFFVSPEKLEGGAK